MRLYSVFIFITLALISTRSEAQRPQYSADVQQGSGGKTMLRGNVKIKQGNMFIKCDDAVIDNNTQDFNAKGNVRVKQEEMVITGEVLDYMGASKVGKFRRNVVMINEDMTLYTDFLDFNSIDNSGYFFNGGKVIDSTSVLESEVGYYIPAQTTYFFKDNVVVTNPDYTIYSDTLKYNYARELVFVEGPTIIKSKSGSYMYCENGWFNTANSTAQFNENAYVKNNEQTIWGDSLYYDQNNGIGKAFGNVVLYDSLEQIKITGQRAVYHEEPERSMVTGEALFMQLGSKDTLFLHADTLRSEFDTSGVYRKLTAYKHAKIFSDQFQAICDSIQYSFVDSVIHFFEEPVLWTDNNQITADKIEVYTKNQKLSRMEIIEEAYIISESDTAQYDQIKGVSMTAFFNKDGHIFQVDVQRNAQSLYYTREQEEAIGMNKAESENMRIFIADGQVQRIVFMSKPTATMIPFKDLTPEDIILRNFEWLIDFRPKEYTDVFKWIEREE